MRNSDRVTWVKIHFRESKNHRIFRVGRSGDGLAHPLPRQSRSTWSRWHRIESRWILNVSREGNSHSLVACSSALPPSMYRNSFPCWGGTSYVLVYSHYSFLLCHVIKYLRYTGRAYRHTLTLHSRTSNISSIEWRKKVIFTEWPRH